MNIDSELQSMDSDLQLIEALNTVALSNLPGQIVSLARSTVPEYIARVEEALADSEITNVALIDVFRKTLAKEKTRHDNALAMSGGDNTNARIVMEANSTGQISIMSLDENGSGHGHRICGPKFNDATGHCVARIELSWEDGEAIRQYLDAIPFPGDK